MPAIILSTRQTLLSLLLRTVPAGYTRPVALDTLQIGLASVMPADDGTGYTEFATGGGYGYARKSLAALDANFSLASDIVSLVAELKFDLFTGNTPECVGYLIFDNAGTLRWATPAGALPQAFTFDGATDVLTRTAHGLSDKQKVRAFALGGLPLPGNIALNTTYYVRDGLSGSLKLAATEGGAAIDLTGSGAVELRRWYGGTYGVDDRAVIPAGELKLQLY